MSEGDSIEAEDNKSETAWKKNSVDLCSSVVAAAIGIFLFIWALKNELWSKTPRYGSVWTQEETEVPET